MTRNIFAFMICMFMTQMGGVVSKDEITQKLGTNTVETIIKAGFVDATGVEKEFKALESEYTDRTTQNKVKTIKIESNELDDSSTYAKWTIILTPEQVGQLKALLTSHSYGEVKPVKIKSGYYTYLFDIQSDDGINFYFIMHRFLDQTYEGKIPEDILVPKEIRKRQNEKEDLIRKVNGMSAPAKQKQKQIESLERQTVELIQGDKIKLAPRIRQEKIQFMKNQYTQNNKLQFIDAYNIGIHENNIKSAISRAGLYDNTIGRVQSARYAVGGAFSGSTQQAYLLRNSFSGESASVYNSYTQKTETTQNVNWRAKNNEGLAFVGLVSGQVIGAGVGVVKGAAEGIEYAEKKRKEDLAKAKMDAESAEVTGATIDSSNRIAVYTGFGRYTYIQLNDDEIVKLFDFLKESKDKGDSRDIFTIVQDQTSGFGGKYKYQYTFYVNKKGIYVMPGYIKITT